MSVLSLCSTTITITRRTGFALEPVAAAPTLTPDRQPVEEGLIQIGLIGTGACNGTVTVIGTVGGVPLIAEVLSFTGRGYKQTTKRYTAVSSFETAGLDNETPIPQVEAKWCGVDGTPRAMVEQVVASGFPAHLDHADSPSWPIGRFGGTETERAWFAVPYIGQDWAPKRGDLILDGEGQSWIVVGDPRWRGVTAENHWEVQVHRRER